MTLRGGYIRDALIYAPAWPAAAPQVVAALLPILSASTVGQTRLIRFTQEGQSLLSTLDTGIEIATLDLVAEMQYQGLEPLFSALLGRAPTHLGAATFPEVIEAGAERHHFELEDNLSFAPWFFGSGIKFGQFVKFGQRRPKAGTLVVDFSGDSLWEYLSATPIGMTLTATPRQPMQIEATFLAHSIDPASSTNTTATLNSATDPVGPAVLLHHGTSRVGIASAVTPLGSGDELPLLNQFRLRLAHDVPAVRSDLETPNIGEPASVNVPTLTGQFTLALHQSHAQAFLTGQRAGTQYMADLIFTGSTIGATSTAYTFEIYLPLIRFLEVRLAHSQGHMTPTTIRWEAETATVAQAGFPAMSRPETRLLIRQTTGLTTHTML